MVHLRTLKQRCARVLHKFCVRASIHHDPNSLLRISENTAPEEHLVVADRDMLSFVTDDDSAMKFVKVRIRGIADDMGA